MFLPCIFFSQLFFSKTVIEIRILKSLVMSLPLLWTQHRPCWPPRGQQVSHHRWIWEFHYSQAMKHTSEGIHSGFETQGYVTGSSKQGYQWPNKKDWCPSKIKQKLYISHFFYIKFPSRQHDPGTLLHKLFQLQLSEICPIRLSYCPSPRCMGLLHLLVETLLKSE